MVFMREPQFVVDAEGQKVAAVVDMQQYAVLTESEATLRSVRQAISATLNALEIRADEQSRRGVILTDTSSVQTFLAVLDAVFRGRNDDSLREEYTAIETAMRQLLTKNSFAAAAAAAAMEAMTIGKSKASDVVRESSQMKALDTATSSADPSPLASEAAFWMDASQEALATVWGNDEDDVYAQLLQE